MAWSYCQGRDLCRARHGSLTFNSFCKDVQGVAKPFPGTHKTAVKAEPGCSGKRAGEGHGLEEEQREGGSPTEGLVLLNLTMAKESR